MRIVAALALVALLVVAMACGVPTRFNATDVTGSDWGRDFALVDHHGKPSRLADFQGKVVVLFFGYTHCPDVCPTTLASMRETMALLGQDSQRIQVLFATIDPNRDTPKLLADYVPWFHPSFIGLWGDEAAIAAITKEFKVFHVRQPGATEDSYSVDHSASSYAFDPQGRLRLVMRHGETPERVAADLRLLLAGK